MDKHTKKKMKKVSIIGIMRNFCLRKNSKVCGVRK